MAAVIDRPAREAAIELRGLAPGSSPGRAGAELDREAGKPLIVSALAGFERDRVALPVRVRPAAGDREDSRTRGGADPHRALGPRAALLPQRVLDGPPGPSSPPCSICPTTGSGEARHRRRRPPHAGSRTSPAACGGSPVNADFAVNDDGSVSVVRARPGRKLDVAATKAALLAAASRISNRTAPLVVSSVAPELTTREARALRVERQPRLVYDPLLGHARPHPEPAAGRRPPRRRRIASRRTFSFNERVGPRTEERGFRAGARDHGRRVRGGRRRRRFTGGDDRLQRRVGGGAAASPPGRRTRSTSTATRSGATPRSTTRTSTSGSGTTPAGLARPQGRVRRERHRRPAPRAPAPCARSRARQES